MENQITQNLADFRERWRPKMGPGAKIPQKNTEAEATDFEELEKKQIEKIRETWRPAIGPASAV